MCSTKFISKIIVNFYFDVENLDMSFVLKDCLVVI